MGITEKKSSFTSNIRKHKHENSSNSSFFHNCNIIKSCESIWISRFYWFGSRRLSRLVFILMYALGLGCRQWADSLERHQVIIIMKTIKNTFIGLKNVLFQVQVFSMIKIYHFRGKLVSNLHFHDNYLCYLCLFNAL